MIINNLEMKKGKLTKVNLNITRLSSREIVDIPIKVSRSTKNGPTILLLGGIHGNEINGIEIVDRLSKDKSLKLLKGSIIFAPIVNQYGYYNNNRYTFDGKDLNRSFPGNMKGSVSQKLAYKLANDLVPLADIIIDFHTGGDQRTNYPQVRCSFRSEKQMELAKHFNQPLIVNAPLRDKSLRKLATQKKVPYLLFEGGKSLERNKEIIDYGIEGTLNLLSKLKMIPTKKVTKHKSKLINSSSWERAEKTGLFKSFKQAGEIVRKGEILAEIKDDNGVIIEKITAPTNGIVIGMEESNNITKGDALFHIGKVDN